MKKGFTLLELIIVIIIIGVLTSLALPRLFTTIEYSRSTEAIAAFSSIRASLERCKLRTGSYSTENCGPNGLSFARLDIENPGLAPNAHFSYLLTLAPDGGGSEINNYYIQASRNTLDGGDGASWIIFYHYPDFCTKKQVFMRAWHAIEGDGGGAFAPLGSYADHCN